MPGVSRPGSPNPGAVLSPLRSSLRRGGRFRSLRSLPAFAPLLPPRARGVAIRRRRPARSPRVEVRRPPSNRVGPRESRQPFLGRFGGARRRVGRHSDSALETKEAGARVQPGGAHRERRRPRGGGSASSASVEEDERAAAPGGAFRGSAQDERRLGLPRSPPAFASWKSGAAGRRRPHDRRHRRGRVAGPPCGGSGSGGRPHSRAGSVRFYRR